MYKIYTKQRGMAHSYIRKLLLIMNSALSGISDADKRKWIMRANLITFILMIALAQVSAATFAQKLTYSKQGASLQEIFKEIKTQTGYNVLYSPDQINVLKKVNVNFKQADLKKVLERLIDDETQEYTIVDNNILIKKKETSFLDKARSVTLNLFQGLFQSIDVRGRVVDSETGNALAGATVRMKGTNKQTSTNGNGEFYLADVEENAMLEISFIGFVKIEVKAGKDLGEIKLVMASSELQEVTINKGYYTTTRTLNTGNVSTVTADEIARQPVSDPLAALISRVPGLSVQQTSGVTGRTFIVRLRGQNSIENGNDPLFIIDGVQYGSEPLNISSRTFTAGGQASPFNYINPADIESIEVLKDADATAIYGSRGANGVILITTKKAKADKLEFDVRYYSGLSEAPQRMKFMNTQEYLAMRREAFKTDNMAPSTLDHDLNGNWDTTRNTNWQDYFIGNTASTNDASINLTMATKTSGFRIGAGYRSGGMIYPGDFRSMRTGVNFSGNHSALENKFNLSFTGSYGYSQNNLPDGGGNGAEQYITLAPNAPDPFNEDGSLNWANSTWQNPMAYFEQTALEKANNLVSNLTISYDILQKLNFRTSFGYTSTNFRQRNLRPWTVADPALGTLIQPNNYRLHQIINSDIRTFVIEPQLTYSRSLFGGSFDILLGGTLQGSARSNVGMSGTGFSSDALMENFAAATTVSGLSRTSSEYSYTALYARAGYSYQNRYVVNLTARRDGSSRFGSGKRFGNFGALGMAWIFSNEDFLNLNSKTLSLGKLRISYGTTGNDQIGEYNYLDTYLVYNLPYQGNTSLIPKQLTNPLYGWERVDKMEVGLDLSFFSGKLDVNSSFYRNKTNNQLVMVPLPSTTGFPSVRANLPATIRNSGFEIDIRSVNIEKPTFSWSSAFNITLPKNKLISFPGIETSPYATKYIVGQPINRQVFSYQYTGLDLNTKLFTFRDVNGDGSITSTQDRLPVFVGQKFYGGLYNNFKIGLFEVDFQLQFVKQNGDAYLYNGVPGGFAGTRGNQVVFDDKYDRQRLSVSNLAVVQQSSLFSSSTGVITDASFIRLKNAGIYCKLPFIKAIKHGKVYLQGQNLLTISKYRGFDPESPNQGVLVAPLRTITLGIQLTL